METYNDRHPEVAVSIKKPRCSARERITRSRIEAVFPEMIRGCHDIGDSDERRCSKTHALSGASKARSGYSKK
jgi:hypothetical protein